MGEALLVKGLGYQVPDPLGNVPVVATACSLLVTVRDSGGNKLVNMPVHCKDGSTWYNYNTNDQGMVLFQCTSGAANIVAWNYSILDSYNVIDQTPATMNVDAPVATKNHLEMNLGNVTGSLTFTSSRTNLKFLDTPALNVRMIGGGGSGDFNNGGGGGAYNEILNFRLDRSTLYTLTVGTSGSNSAGGTTSAFGLSAIGGGSGSTGGSAGGTESYKGGNGGGINKNGYASSYANSSFNYGGGGAGRANGILTGTNSYWYSVYHNDSYTDDTGWFGYASSYTYYDTASNYVRRYGMNGGGNSIYVIKNGASVTAWSIHAQGYPSPYVLYYNTKSSAEQGKYGSGGGAGCICNTGSSYSGAQGGSGAIFIDLLDS